MHNTSREQQRAFDGSNQSCEIKLSSNAETGVLTDMFDRAAVEIACGAFFKPKHGLTPRRGMAKAVNSH